jgi:uncharacterized membrane protein YphA (DoxX/SURF4 family)
LPPIIEIACSSQVVGKLDLAEIVHSIKAGGLSMQKNASMMWGLFLLRVGLGCYLGLWAIDKFIAPDLTVDIFSHFYSLEINASIAIIFGALELVLSLLIILGAYKTATYGLGLLVYTVSISSMYEQLLSPFGVNHFIIAAIPIFFAFITLFLLRRFDTKLSLGKKKSLFA